MKRGRPAILSGRSRRGTLVPTTRRSALVFGVATPVASRSRSTRCASSPYVVVLPVSSPSTPSRTVIRCGSTPRRRAASATNRARASAHAWRSAAPEWATDMLPAVIPSSGPSVVSAAIIRTSATSTSSSSAAIWASAVRMPWPSSTLPTRTVTVPSVATRSQRDSRGLAASPAGRVAAAVTPRSRCGRRRGRRRRRGGWRSRPAGGRRTGTDAVAGRRSRRPRRDGGRRRAARRR